MKAYYQDMVTAKSWNVLRLIKTKIGFTLIGGWAIYLFTEALKSKDIDIIIDYQALGVLKKEFDIVKNERLSKYEIKLEGIDIDIYLPHYSNLGIPAEEIIKHTDKIEGYVLPQKEILLITKLKAYSSRSGSIKGEKDKIDVMSLLMLPDFEYDRYFEFLEKYKLGQYKDLMIKLLKDAYEIPELGLNRHSFSKKKKELLKKVSG